jgi:hypothetical protein
MSNANFSKKKISTGDKRNRATIENGWAPLGHSTNPKGGGCGPWNDNRVPLISGYFLKKESTVMSGGK